MRKTASQIADEVLTKVAAGLGTGAATPGGGLGRSSAVSMQSTAPKPTMPGATGQAPMLKPPKMSQQVRLPSTAIGGKMGPAVPAAPPGIPKPTAGKATGLK